MRYDFVYFAYLNKESLIVVVVVKPRAVEYRVMAQVLVASLSTRRLRISYMSVHVEFVMDRSATRPFTLTV